MDGDYSPHLGSDAKPGLVVSRRVGTWYLGTLAVLAGGQPRLVIGAMGMVFGSLLTRPSTDLV
jgi:hypothetical protein